MKNVTGKLGKQQLVCEMLVLFRKEVVYKEDRKNPGSLAECGPNTGSWSAY
jgi:hypothetical protein